MNLLNEWNSIALNSSITSPDESVKNTHRQDGVFAALLEKHRQLNYWDKIEGKFIHGVTIKQKGMTFKETQFRRFPFAYKKSTPKRKYSLISTTTR